MDTFVTADSPTGESGSTATIETSPAGGVGSVDPATGQPTTVGDAGQSDNGSPQGRPEGGQSQEGNKGSKLFRDLTELRARNRELREQVRSFDSMRQELAELREEMNRRNQPGAAKTPESFWSDPIGTLNDRLQALGDELRNSITSEFHTTREQEFQRQQLRQETESATEFIRSQAGYDPSDDEALIEIIEGIPNHQQLSPQWKAEYAWLKLQNERGVGDKSVQKQRASSVQGQPPGLGFGKKTWARAEFEAALDLCEKNIKDPKYSELFKELELANREGRVK